MRLIAESGSTKTDWVLLLNKEVILKTQTIGFNPLFISEEQINNELLNSELFEYKDAVEEIHFYGAGCSSPKRNQIISDGLSPFFTKATISIDSEGMNGEASTEKSCFPKTF